MDGHIGLRRPADDLLIEGPQRMAAVHQHHQAAQTAPLAQISIELTVPGVLQLLRHFGVAVAGQIDNALRCAHGKEVDQSGAARGARGFRELLAPD